MCANAQHTLMCKIYKFNWRTMDKYTKYINDSLSLFLHTSSAYIHRVILDAHTQKKTVPMPKNTHKIQTLNH